MKRSLLYTFSIALVVVFVLFAVSSIQASDPLKLSFFPLISNAQTSNPRGTLFVFSSVGTTTGSGHGRTGMNDICQASDPESHFCNLREIENAFVTTGVSFPFAFSQSWVDNVRLDPANSNGIYVWSSGDVYTRNCEGWLDDSPGSSGYTITKFASDYQSDTCNNLNSIACCKWIP